MQEIQAHVIELVRQTGKSNTQIARETGLGDTTVRRFMNGEDSSVNTLVAIAGAANITASDLIEYIPAKTAVAMEMVKQEMEQEFKPYSPHCATDCTARRRFDENLKTITELYDKRIAEHKEVIAEKNRRIRRFVILSVSLLVLLVASLVHSIYAIIQMA